MTKIALCMIVKDAETTIGACLDSILPFVDEAYIGFGGKSSDRTEAIVHQKLDEWRGPESGPSPLGRHARTPQIEWHDDFAEARNAVWEQVVDQGSADWAIWLDADDVLLNGDKLRDSIAKAEEANANCLVLPYHYEEDEFGNLTCTLVRERVARTPANWHWGGPIGAVHENLVLDEPLPFAPMYDPEIVVRHQPNRPREHKRTRNLDILYSSLAKTEPNPPRALLYYLGRENAARGNLKEAFLHLNRYIASAEINDEAYQVALMIADVLRADSRFDDAAIAALRAVHFQPEWPDALLLMARIAFEQGHWTDTIEWTKAAQTKKPPTTGLIIDPKNYTFWPNYYLGMAQARLGQLDEAIQNLGEAARIAPDEALLETLRAIMRTREEQSVYDSFTALYRHLGHNSEWMKARSLFSIAPAAIQRSPEIQELWRKVDLMTRHIVDPRAMEEFYHANPRWVPAEDELILSEGAGSGLSQRIQFALKALCDPPKYVLDVGCSDGEVALPLAKHGYKVLGIDLNPTPVKLAQERAEKWGLADRAEFQQGTIDDVLEEYAVRGLETRNRFDAAVAFEIIEHLPDVKGFLDKLDRLANKVLLTTPYLDWDNGHPPDWDKLEPKNHIRIFDLIDLEIELAPRGQIVDLYREPYGPSAWIFASYYPGRSTKGSITFLTPTTLEPYGPRKLKEEGLGGSETAAIRLSEELAATGMNVSIYGRIDSAGYYNGVRYREWEFFEPGVKQDTIVAWRAPEIADMRLNTDNLVLWMHDAGAGDKLTRERAEKFDTIVLLSKWHVETMVQQYPFLDEMRDKIVVIGNGVDANRFVNAIGGGVERDPHRVIFPSSPDRGLDTILEYIWPKVLEKVPDASLHVYYGWNNIDKLIQMGAEPLAQFKQKIANLVVESRNVTMHGRVNQEELARAMLQSSIWLYPPGTFFGPFYETFCITAIEAQQAAVIPVTSDLAGLAETVKSGVIIPSHGPDGRLIDPKSQVQEYADAVIRLMTDEGARINAQDEALLNVSRETWEDVAARWRKDVLHADVAMTTADFPTYIAPFVARERLRQLDELIGYPTSGEDPPIPL